MKTTLSFLAGIFVGLLIAPEKGSETRKKVVEKANDLTDQLKHAFSGDGEMKYSKTSSQDKPSSSTT